MTDLSSMSDDELMKALNGPHSDLSSMSDADLMKALNAPEPATAPSATLDVAKSLGSGLVRGAAGLVGLPGDISEQIGLGVQFLGDKIGLPRPAPDAPQPPSLKPTASQVLDFIQSNVGTLPQPQTTAGRYAQSVGEFVPAATIGPGGLAAKTIAAIGGGLGSEAAGQLAEGQSPGWQVAARIAGGTLGAMGPGALARAITPNPISPARQRLVDILQNEGVTSLTAGQITGNKALQYAENALGNAPLSGGRAAQIEQEGQRQFTEAAMRRAGTGPDATPEVLAQNHDRLGQAFRDLSARNTLIPDNQFITDLTDAVRNYRRVPDSQQRQMVQGYVDDIIQHVNAGAMPGPQYQEMRSRLSRQSNSLRQSDPTLSEALRGMRNALDDAMGRSIPPDDLHAWQTARQEYAAQKTLEKAATGAGEATAEGQITPAKLRNAATVGNRGAFARGEGQFSELARAGSGIMTPLPNSGTAQRNFVFDLLNGATFGAIPAASGRVLMSAPAQAYLANQLLAGAAPASGPTRDALIRALLSQDRTRALEGP